MTREQQTNSAEDVLADVGGSLREWAPSRDEERGALDRVWAGLRWKANQVPAEVMRSVVLGSALPERRRVEGPPARWHRRSMVRAAAAAALVIVAVGGTILWPRGVRVYAAGNDGLQVTLADDSRVEMRAHAEMTVGRASDGIQIDLKTGDIIVSAARQRDGHLYVRTKDMTVALSAVAHRAKVDVDGTVFLASTGQQGSRVGVIEGEVRVRDGDVETRLRPGEQVATSPTIAQRSLAENITWSRHAATHLAVLASFQKNVANTAGRLEPLNQTPATAQGGATATTSPTFEEASVRPCDPDNLPAGVPGARGGGGAANSFAMTPGRTYALCMTAATLIRTAYGYGAVGWEFDGRLDFGNPNGPGRMRPFDIGSVSGLGAEDGRRVRGGPDWVRTERYTIEAVANGAASAAAMSGPMLLALLEQRFKLKSHVETVQVPAYSLVVAPGGLKIKEATCTPEPAAGPAPPGSGSRIPDRVRRNVDFVRSNLDAARRGDAISGPCMVGAAINGPNAVYVAAGGLLPDFRQLLEAAVTDRTGIPRTTRFNYVLEFPLAEGRPTGLIGLMWESGLEHGIDLQIAANPSRVPLAPELPAAVEQQLGLRLEPAQGSREVVVIDSIERPGPN